MVKESFFDTEFLEKVLKLVSTHTESINSEFQLKTWVWPKEKPISIGFYINMALFTDVHLVCLLSKEELLKIGIYIRENYNKKAIDLIEFITSERILSENPDLEHLIPGWIVSNIIEPKVYFNYKENQDIIILYLKEALTRLINLYKVFLEKTDTLHFSDFPLEEQHNFIIFSYPRTGSNFLIALLNTAEDILCHLEIFHDVDIFVYSNDYKWYGIDFNLRDLNPYNFIKRLYLCTYFSNLKSNIRCVGFKIFEDHNEKYINACLNLKDFKKILLIRENKLASYSSLLIANKTNEWFKVSDSSQESVGKVFFDENRFKEYLDRIYTFENRIKSFFEGELYIYYYHDVKNLHKLRDLLRFIGSKGDIYVKDYIKKQNPWNIIERFENPEDVLKFLKKIGREDWQYETLSSQTET